MFRFKVLLCFLVISFAKSASFAEEEPASFRNNLEFNAGVEARYDTNIFNYSRDDIDEFNANTNPEKFNRIKSRDDFVISPLWEVVFRDELFSHTFRLAFEAEPHFFAQNKVKDYESYRLNLRQYLNKGEYLEFRYNHIPDYFLKNLFDRDLNKFRKATFSSRLFSLGYRRPINETLDARIRYLYEINDYNGNFEEYDMTSQAANLAFWHKLNPYLNAEIYFEFERADAKGDLGSTARVESDTSYDKYEIGLRQNLELSKKTSFFTRYIFSFRDYTTDNPLTLDPFHRDRQDKIQRISLGFECKLTKVTHVVLEYEYSLKDVNTASKDPDLINAAILGYEKNIVRLSVKHSF